MGGMGSSPERRGTTIDLPALGKRSRALLTRQQLTWLTLIATWLYSYMAMQRDQQLSMLFSALADPTRRAILAKLSQGEATVSELAEPFHLAQPTISKHLRV